MPRFPSSSRACTALGALVVVAATVGLLIPVFRNGSQASAARPHDPVAADFHLHAATAWAKQSQFSAAVTESRKALALDPGASDVHRILGYAYYRMKRYPEARAALERAVELNPGEPFSACFLGLTYAEHPTAPTHERRARELLEGAVGQYQGAEAWYGLGLLSLRGGRLDQAIRYLREAVETDPGWESGRYRLAEAYRRAGRLSDAAREAGIFELLRRTRPEYDRLVARVAEAPEDERARLELARFCRRTQRQREALEQYRTLASRAPSPEALQGLNAAAEALGEPRLAEAAQR